MDIPKGYCQCGCGQKTNVAPQKIKSLGMEKGEPYKFVYNHHNRGDNHWLWKGRTERKDAIYITTPDRGRVREHILIVEKALGHSIPGGVEIHHVNENPFDNSSGNLVVCQDSAYHKLLHQRTRSLKACGHVGWRKCRFCKEYGNPESMLISKKKDKSDQYYHAACGAKYKRDRKKEVMPV